MKIANVRFVVDDEDGDDEEETNQTKARSKARLSRPGGASRTASRVSLQGQAYNRVDRQDGKTLLSNMECIPADTENSVLLRCFSSEQR